MKATEANLLKFLKKSPQFVIPIYQRNYSWTDTQCKQLWRDLMRAGRDDEIQAHFIGSIVYVERALSSVTSQEAMLVIDGQQRLTTSTLLVAALAKHFHTNGLGELLGAFSNSKLRNYYLLNPEEEGERHYKLLLSETDKDTLLAILDDKEKPTKFSNRIYENYKLFQELIDSNKEELEAICQGIAKLVIVDVALDRAQDNPQLIFESMNSTGLELTQADLIRNYILMELEPQLQTTLYKTYWKPMEDDFGQAAYTVHFDAFMRHYLTAKTGNIPNVKNVYTDFKEFASKKDKRDLVAEIHKYASYYCAIALNKEENKELQQAFHDLRELKVDVAYPFLLDVYFDYKQGLLKSSDVLHIVRLVESYVFRRAVCGLPPNSLNKIFAGMSRTVKEKLKESRCYLESVQATLLLLPSYRRFPLDEEFQRELKVRDLYNFRSRSYWLRRLENHGRKERVMVEDYTIEHILPQTLSEEWQNALAPDWKGVQQKWLHTLGNLTLTGYNTKYSNRPFIYKRDEAKDDDGNSVGFSSSPLWLNSGLGKVTTWNEEAIEERANRLSQKAVKVWVAPTLDDDVLESYKKTLEKSGQNYSIHDHPYLQGAMCDVFTALRKSICELDPCVTEVFLKLYVAYKAETNFVDIDPQAKQLRLVLNMPFHQIDDPKKIGRDITGLVLRCNGNVEVRLSRLEDLPYVMGLIRQSFEYQMDSVQ